MANELKLGLLIGAAVSSSVGAAFKDVTGRIKSLEVAGSKSRALQKNIGDTIRLRNEWQKAHATGAAGAEGLRRKLESNLSTLKAQGVQVRSLTKEYERLGRAGRAADQRQLGQTQLREGASGVGRGLAVGAAGVAMVAIPAKVSADFGAVVRDIAIKAGIANKPEEAQMSRTIIDTASSTGMARNEVAEVVNALVGAGMDLDKALDYAPVAAKFVVGQGADGTDTAKMINALGQNAKITDPLQMQKALEAIAYQGQAGSFEASDMAKWFPVLLAGMGKLGITGNESVASLGAMLQVQMKTAGGADEAANNLKNWMEKIGSGEVVKAYAGAGIDYQGSMNTGLQNGKSTLETSFELAQKYVEKTDPAKAKALSEGAAKISQEADPEKAKQMMVSLEQALRTGDLFADMQVKAALTAFMQNKALYEQLKKDSSSASGILDKNLAERRDTSAQKWKEMAQSTNDAMRSIGDALRPATDTVATVLTSVAKSITEVSDKAPGLAMGIVGVGATIATVVSALGALKMGKGLLNLARGATGGRGSRDDADSGGADDDADEGHKGKAAAIAALVGAGVKAYSGKADDDDDPKAGLIDAGMKVFESFLEGKKEDGGDDGPQEVTVVNAAAIGAAIRAAGGSGGGPGDAARRGGRRSRNGGRSGRRSSNRPPDRPPSRPPAPPPAPPRPVPVPGAGVVGRLTSAASGLGRAVPVAALFEAGSRAVETYMSDSAQEEKAEAYGEAAGGLAGTMAGAAAGAAIGSVVPILGTVVGGMVGAYLGSMGGEMLGGITGRSLFGGDAAEQSDEQKALMAARPVVAPDGVTRNGAIPATPSLADAANAFAAPTAKTPIAALMMPVDKSAASVAAAAPRIEQSITNAPVLNITVHGDVKDPRLLAKELMPEIQRQINDANKQASRRQMADEAHT